MVSQVLKSGGSLTAAQLDALLAGFSLDTPGGITVESTTAAGGSIDWTYQVGNAAVDFLAAGDVITLSFDVQINDGIFTVTQTVTITITGTNDVPVIEGATNPAAILEVAGDSSTQDIPATVGTITITDQDLGDTLTVTVTGDATANYNGTGTVPAEDSVDVAALIAEGAISFDALISDGETQTINWTWDPAAADLDWLREGENLVLTYVAQVDDGQGNVGAQNLVITITGTNDVPVIEGATNPAAILEVAGDSSTQDIPATVGTITITDQDLGDTLTVTVTGDATANYNGTGTVPAEDSVDVAALIAEGAISFDALISDGETQTINWTWDPAAADLDWLREGENLVLTYVAQVDDGQGNVGAQNLVITITGTNDVPVIEGATNPAAILEVAGDSSTQDIPATVGTITITDQDLGDTLTVTVTGDATANYNGTGTVPAEDSVDVAALIAEGAISFDALISDGETQTINWTWDPAAADLDWLREGENLVLTYVAQVDDGQGNVGAQNLVITITGTNDVPVIDATSVITGSVTESGDIADINEAGFGGSLSSDVVLTAGSQALLDGLQADGSGLEAALTAITTELGDPSQAIAVIWDYLDDNYVNGGPTQDPINEAFIAVGCGLCRPGQGRHDQPARRCDGKIHSGQQRQQYSAAGTEPA